MTPQGSFLCSEEPAILTYPSNINSIPSHPVYLVSISVLSSHLCLVLTCSLCQVSPPLLLYMCHMPYPYHSPWSEHMNNIWWAVQIVKLLICCFLQSPLTSSILDQNIFLSTLSLCTSHNVRIIVSHTHTHKITDIIIVTVTFHVMLLTCGTVHSEQPVYSVCLLGWHKQCWLVACVNLPNFCWQFHALYFLSFALTATGIIIYAVKRTPIFTQSQQPVTYRWVTRSNGANFQVVTVV